MSIQAIAWVLDNSEAEGIDRLILLALANYVDDTGHAWPSLETLADKTRLDRSTICRHLPNLEELGELEITRGGGRYRSNIYYLPRLPGAEKQSQAATVKSERNSRRMVEKQSQNGRETVALLRHKPLVTVSEPNARATKPSQAATVSAEPPIGLGGSIAAPDRCWVCGRLRLGDCLCDRGPILEWGLKPTALLPDRDDDAGRSPLQERMAQTVARLSHATG